MAPGQASSHCPSRRCSQPSRATHQYVLLKSVLLSPALSLLQPASANELALATVSCDHAHGMPGSTQKPDLFFAIVMQTVGEPSAKVTMSSAIAILLSTNSGFSAMSRTFAANASCPLHQRCTPRPLSVLPCSCTASAYLWSLGCVRH